ncbi:MAG: hypothetical protein MR567_04255 [Oscillospiraceae bacterium]|nr:hypothetical protein [Oscillospiraceae bacterium]
MTELVLIKHTGHAKIDTIRKYYANRTETTDKLILDGVRQTGSEIESFLSHSKNKAAESSPDHYYETDLEIEFETQSIPPAIPVDDEDGEDIIF